MTALAAYSTSSKMRPDLYGRSFGKRRAAKPVEAGVEVHCSNRCRSPESPEDGQVRGGDAIDAQPDQLVKTLAVVDPCGLVGSGCA